VSIAFDETTKLSDVDLLLAVLNGGAAPGFTAASLAPGVSPAIAPGSQFARSSAFMIQVGGFLFLLLYMSLELVLLLFCFSAFPLFLN